MKIPKVSLIKGLIAAGAVLVLSTGAVVASKPGWASPALNLVGIKQATTPVTATNTATTSTEDTTTAPTETPTPPPPADPVDPAKEAQRQAAAKLPTPPPAPTGEYNADGTKRTVVYVIMVRCENGVRVVKDVYNDNSTKERITDIPCVVLPKKKVTAATAVQKVAVDGDPHFSYGSPYQAWCDYTFDNDTSISLFLSGSNNPAHTVPCLPVGSEVGLTYGQ